MMADDDTVVVGETPETASNADMGEASEALKQRIATLEDSLLRAKADYQNLQRRNMSERAEAILYANADLMKSLLPVVEGLQRAIESAKSSDNLKSVFEGVRLVHEDLMKSLGGHGLETIDAKGKKFDPHVHEALMMQPTKDVADGTVIEEVGRGYQLRDRVLRPAKVIVAKGE